MHWPLVERGPVDTISTAVVQSLVGEIINIYLRMVHTNINIAVRTLTNIAVLTGSPVPISTTLTSDKSPAVID